MAARRARCRHHGRAAGGYAHELTQLAWLDQYRHPPLGFSLISILDAPSISMGRPNTAVLVDTPLWSVLVFSRVRLSSG